MKRRRNNETPREHTRKVERACERKKNIIIPILADSPLLREQSEREGRGRSFITSVLFMLSTHA